MSNDASSAVTLDNAYHCLFSSAERPCIYILEKLLDSEHKNSSHLWTITIHRAERRFFLLTINNIHHSYSRTYAIDYSITMRETITAIPLFFKQPIVLMNVYVHI
jgi:hypothetical protein